MPSCEVLVVIVTHNSEAVVGALLESLPAALSPLRYSVVAVDNGSTDRTDGVLARFPDCAVIREENRGYAAAINRGVSDGPPADAILVLNPDVVLRPGSVPAMAAALARSGVGIVAPQIRGVDGELHRSLRRTPTLLRAAGLTRTGLAPFAEQYVHDSEYVAGREVAWATGAVLLVSSQCHRALGGWDESYFLHSEETDFCLRAADLGWRTYYEPRAVVMHVGQASGYSGAVHAMQVVNRVRQYHRRHGTVATSAYYVLTLLSEGSWVLRGKPQSRVSVSALVRPRRRPPELGCSGRILPR